MFVARHDGLDGAEGMDKDAVHFVDEFVDGCLASCCPEVEEEMAKGPFVSVCFVIVVLEFLRLFCEELATLLARINPIE